MSLMEARIDLQLIFQALAGEIEDPDLVEKIDSLAPRGYTKILIGMLSSLETGSESELDPTHLKKKVDDAMNVVVTNILLAIVDCVHRDHAAAMISAIEAMLKEPVDVEELCASGRPKKISEVALLSSFSLRDVVMSLSEGEAQFMFDKLNEKMK